MIVCEEILGNVKDKEFSGCFRDEVEIEWHEAYKRINQKTTKGDREIGIRLGTEILTRGLRDGDVLYREGDTVITVCVPPCEVIVIDVREDHARMACKVCYEIGNKHAALMWGDTKLQLLPRTMNRLWYCFRSFMESLSGVMSESWILTGVFQAR